MVCETSSAHSPGAQRGASYRKVSTRLALRFLLALLLLHRLALRRDRRDYRWGTVQRFGKLIVVGGDGAPASDRIRIG